MEVDVDGVVDVVDVVAVAAAAAVAVEEDAAAFFAMAFQDAAEVQRRHL